MSCTHTWNVRTYAERLLDARGWPTGVYQASETKTCGCGAFETRRVPGTRSKSPEEAMALYRGLTTHEPA